MAYTRFQRSLNARKQLRDRRGRWIEMGGGVKFRFGGADRRGSVQGFDGDYVIIDSVNPTTGQNERLKRHRSEIENDGSKASITQARSRIRARREDDSASEGLHNTDSDSERRLNQLGIKSDDARRISQADSREDAERAWSESEGGQAADARYAELTDAPALSSAEKAFKTRYENTKNAIAERYQNDPNEIYEDGLGNYSIPKDQIDSKGLADLSEGDRILGKGQRNSPEITKSGDRDKTNGEVLEVVGKETGPDGATTLKVRDEDGNEREYSYNKRAGDNAAFTPADSLYDAPAGEDSDSDLTPDDMPDISSWENLDPDGSGDGPIRMRDPESGDEFFVKIPDDNMQALNDALASRLYDEAGIRSATQEPVKLGDSGRLGTASPAIPDATEDLRERVEAGDKEYLDDLREGFAVDAWLGNNNPGGEYDENIQSDTNGQPVRVSQSGALLFDGDDNERSLKNSVTEWNSMRRKGSPSEGIYKDMTLEQMKESARRVSSISDEDIDRIVDGVDLPEATATPLKKTLKARRNDIAKRAGIDSETPAEKATPQDGAPKPARRAQRRTEPEDTTPAESEESPAEDNTEPSADELEAPTEDELDSAEEIPYDDYLASESVRLQNMPRGAVVRSDGGDEYTHTAYGERDAWSDESGNEIGDSTDLAEIGYGNKLRRLDSNGDVVPEDREDQASDEADTPDPLSDSQRAQAVKVSEVPAGGTVTDDDGDSYTRNADDEWERDDTGDLIGDDEDLARYVGDQSLNVDENNPLNHSYNANVVDTRNYRPTDENGIPRDRTPEEAAVLQRAKDAEPGDKFVDDDGDEYTKHENDKWTRGDDDVEETGFNNSEAFLSQIGPWNPRPADEDSTAPEAEEQAPEPFEYQPLSFGRKKGGTTDSRDEAVEQINENIAPMRSQPNSIGLGKGTPTPLGEIKGNRLFARTTRDSTKEPGELEFVFGDGDTRDPENNLLDIEPVRLKPGEEFTSETLKKIENSLTSSQDSDAPASPESPGTPETDAPEPLDAPTAPGESSGRITDPSDLDSRPEGSRIQISQNNKTRIATKGEDGKWRDEATNRVISKPVPKNSNVTDLPDGTPEVDQNIGGDSELTRDGLKALPSGSRVDMRNTRDEGTKSWKKNDDGSWTDEDRNSRSSDEIADDLPEDVLVDRIGSTPAQDRAESGDREIPGQGDLFDEPALTEEDTDGQRTDSDLPGDSGERPDAGGRGDDSGDGPLDFRSTGKAQDHGRESAIQEDGGSTPVLYEVDSADADKFRDAISKLKDTKYGAAAYVYDSEDYANMRMFMNESGTAGYALNGDEIVSVFSLPDSPDKGVGRHLIASAVGQGGKRLDAFDTVLPKIYAKEGFKPVARTSWDDEYAPEGWDKDTFKDYNGGEPDVVFMRHDPDSVGKSYDPSEGRRVDSYDEGIAAARGEDRASDISDSNPGDSIASEDDFFTKDDDGNWYDVEGNSLTDEQLARRLRGKEYEKVSQDGEDTSTPPEGGEEDSIPADEPTEVSDAPEIPEKVQEELEEAIEEFDPENDDTAENIAALDAMPRGTRISGDGVSFTKMVKNWKQDDYPDDAPKSGNKYTSEDVLLNVDVNDALVTPPEAPKSRKPAPTPAQPPVPIRVDDFGNEFIDNGSGKPHYKGDTVNAGGRSPMVGVIDSFSPDGRTMKIRDNKDGRLKMKKTSDISQIKNDDDAPDLSGDDSARREELPAGTKLTNDSLTPNGDYLEKRWDGIWEQKDREGNVTKEFGDDDFKDSDWNFFDKKSDDDRRDRDRKEAEREKREEDRLRKKEDAEEDKRRKAEEREERRIEREQNREEEKKRLAEEKEVNDWIKDAERKERETRQREEREAREARKEAEKKEREKRAEELKELRKDIDERSRAERAQKQEEDRRLRAEERARDNEARDRRIAEERKERDDRRKELADLKRDIIERDREERKKLRDEEKAERDKEREDKRKEREEKKERDRAQRERERRRRERDRNARRRREDDEDEKKKRRKRRNRRDMDGNGLDNFPGGFPGGLPLPHLPEGKKGRKPGAGEGRKGRAPAGAEPTSPVTPSKAIDPVTPTIPTTPAATPDGTPEVSLPGDEGITPDTRLGLPDAEVPDSGDSRGTSEDSRITGVSDSALPADQAAQNDASRSVAGTRLESVGDLEAVQPGTMIARSGEYNAPLRRTEDGTWASATTGEEVSSADLFEDEAGWDVVSPNIPGVLLEDDEAFSDAAQGVVVTPTENSPAADMDVADFEKQADGTWMPRDAAGRAIPGMDNIRAEEASTVIGPAVVDSAPEAALVTDSDPSGVMRLVGEARERISSVAAPRDTPESEHMRWTPGTPVSAIGDFNNAVEGTTIQDINNPDTYYRKNADGTWSPAESSGTATSTERITPADLVSSELEFQVGRASTAAGMEFPSRVLADKGELDFLPTLAVVSSQDPTEGGGHYVKHPDGNWRFVPPVGSVQTSGRTLTPEEFGRVIADQRMTAYPTSSLPTIPQVGARAVSSSDLQVMPTGTVLTDGTRTDGEGRVFVKSPDGTWAFHNRSGVEQATGFNDTDIEGMSRISGVVQEEFAGPFSAEDSPVGTRALVDDDSGVRAPYVKTATGSWARLDGDGNPVWPEISQEDLFDSANSASAVEISRPRKAAGDPANMLDIHTAPNGSRISVTTPEGATADLLKTGADEWRTAGSGTPMSERAIARMLNEEEAAATFDTIGNGEADSTRDSGMEFDAPSTVRGADDSLITSGKYVENPETGTLGVVESVNPASGQAVVRDAETGTTSVVPAAGLQILSRNPAIDFAQAEGQQIRQMASDMQVPAPTPDSTSNYFGQERPSAPAQSTFDGPLVPTEWADALKASFEAMPTNAGRRFEDSPFAPVLAALSRRGITATPFTTEGVRRTQPIGSGPTDAFGAMAGAGLSSPEEASAARAAFRQNLAAAQAVEAENAAARAAHAEEVARWGAANGVDQVLFDAETFELKGIGGQEANYMIGTDYWMDATFVSIDDLEENQQMSLKYVFGGQTTNSVVADEIRNAGPASIEDGYAGFSNETQGIVEGLDEAIVKSSFKMDTRVLFTARMRDFVDSEGSALAENQDVSTLVGSTITDYGYITASVDTNPREEDAARDILMYVRVPAGYNGAWVGGKNSDYGTTNGREVLLPRGTKMFVHRVAGTDKGMREVYAEIVPLDWNPTASRPATSTGDSE